MGLGDVHVHCQVSDLHPDLSGTAECRGLPVSDSWNTKKMLFETVNIVCALNEWGEREKEVWAGNLTHCS